MTTRVMWCMTAHVIWCMATCVIESMVTQLILRVINHLRISVNTRVKRCQVTYVRTYVNRSVMPDGDRPWVRPLVGSLAEGLEVGERPGRDVLTPPRLARRVHEWCPSVARRGGV